MELFFCNIIDLHVSTEDGHHQKATSTSEEILEVYDTHVLSFL
jgi:hypothetical protein